MAWFKRNNKPEIRADTGIVQYEDALLKALFGSNGITKETALQIPTVSGAIDLIAGIVASTPIKLYKENNGEVSEIQGDIRVFLLNDEPGDTMNAHEFWRAIVRDYYLGKGGYAYINKQRGRPKSLHYVDESFVTIQKSKDPIYKDFKILVNGKLYEPFDFLKIIRNTKDGASGVSIVEENSKILEVAYISLIFERNLIKRGGNKKGFLKSEKRIDEKAMKTLRESFANLYSNDAAEMAIVLNNGVDFKESSSTAVELQLNENKTTNAGEIAKLFHISTSAMSGNASADDIAGIARLAAIPLMTTIQCALNRDFLLEKEKGVFYWAFDTKELLKGDMKTRFDAYQTALESNFMQIDEVRFLEDLPALGLNWIKLGLQDVLYDPETKILYTPNTGKADAMDEKRLQENPDSVKEGDEDKKGTTGAEQ